MLSKLNVKLAKVLGCACVGVFLVVCATAGLATASAVRPDPTLGYTAPSVEGNEAAESGSFGINARGESFGSLEGVLPGEEPDLVLVAATNGETGYVRKGDLAEATRENLSYEEAIAMQESYDAIAADMLQVALSEDVSGGELTDEGAAEIVEKMHVGDSPEIDYEAIAEEAADDFVATARSGIDESTLPDAERIEEAYAEIVLKTTKYIPVYESDGVTVIGEYPVTQM